MRYSNYKYAFTAIFETRLPVKLQSKGLERIRKNMRLKNVPGAREVVADHERAMETPRENKGIWRQVFQNSSPLHIEIGMGKGRFIMDMARLHPEINYIGIEKYSSVLIRGLQKLDEAPLNNVFFIRMDAEYIEDVFGEGEVDRIYLNFSDPWPKDRHAKRRLPSRAFLERYNKILSPKGRVEFKTDNSPLFDFALEEAAAMNWKLLACTRDLHSEAALMEGNVMTEYEEKFSSQGNPICKMVISR